MPVKTRLTREQIAQRAALELPDGAFVNLGWGIPNLIADHLPPGISVYFHSENGILGMGRRAKRRRRRLRPGGRHESAGDAGSRRILLSSGRRAPDDSRRSPGCRGARRLSGFRKGRSRQLESPRREGIRRDRRSHGYCRGHEAADCLHGAHHERRRAENRAGMHVSADRARLRGHHRHRSRSDRCARGWIDAARSGARMDRGGSAAANRRETDIFQRTCQRCGFPSEAAIAPSAASPFSHAIS